MSASDSTGIRVPRSDARRARPEAGPASRHNWPERLARQAYRRAEALLELDEPELLPMSCGTVTTAIACPSIGSSPEWHVRLIVYVRPALSVPERSART